MNKLAFIGITGMLGTPVALEMLRAGFQVTALVRNPARAHKKLPKAVRLVMGDVRDRLALAELLKGQEAVYINLNISPDELNTDFHAETDGLTNIIGVAKEMGIRRIAFISSLVMNYQGMNGFSWWVFDVKHRAVQLIRESGIPYTIFYPSSFMENFHGNYRRGNRIMLAGRSMHKMYFIAADDFARQVTRSFQLSPEGNREYAVQGVEAFTADEAAAEFIKFRTKEKLTISRAPLGLLKLLGTFNRRMNYGAHIIEALNHYPEKFQAHDTWKELGPPTITLRQFAAES